MLRQTSDTSKCIIGIVIGNIYFLDCLINIDNCLEKKQSKEKKIERNSQVLKTVFQINGQHKIKKKKTILN